ncbi:MAG TPA: glycosyltransferase family 9 protein [Granulicella sp.]|nr:glycosyltransferase family 9 protein [Granulicella sp.]
MKSPPERVLIYRLGSLGDTLVALPALHLIARAFPAAERRLLTNLPVSAKAPPAAAILADTGLVQGYFRYPVGTRSPRELLSLWNQLRRWRPQVIVYLGSARGIPSARRDARFFRLCRIAHQIGVPLTDDMQQNRPEGPSQQLEPEAARLARNLAELGDARLDDPTSWDLQLTPDEIATARQALVPAGLRPILAVSVGTKVQSKDWGRENWRALLARIAERHPGHALALCGAPEEADASDFAAQGWSSAQPADPGAPQPGPVLNLCGQLTPRESAAVFADSRLFLGHDSGPMHLAAAVQTPCVAIFAARNKPRMWFPYGDQHRVVYHQVECWGCGLETCTIEQKRCITSITVDEVMTQVDQALASTPATRYQSLSQS